MVAEQGSSDDKFDEGKNFKFQAGLRLRSVAADYLQNTNFKWWMSGVE